QRALERHARGDVGARADPLAHGAVELEDRRAAGGDVAKAAVGGAHPVLDRVDALGAHRALPGGADTGAVVRMHRVEPAVPEHLVGRLTGDLAPARQVLVDAAVGRRRPDDLRGRLDQRAVALFAVAQGEQGVVDAAHEAPAYGARVARCHSAWAASTASRAAVTARRSSSSASATSASSPACGAAGSTAASPPSASPLSASRSLSPAGRSARPPRANQPAAKAAASRPRMSSCSEVTAGIAT